MKFLCDNCKAKYQISDDKVAGKTVRMKCRKCGHQIEVRAAVTETSVSVAPPKPDAPATGAPGAGAGSPGGAAGAKRPGLATSLSAARPQTQKMSRPEPGGLAGAFNKSVKEEHVPSSAKPFSSPSAAPATLGSSLGSNLDALDVSMTEEWYVAINGVPVGPIRVSELRRKAAGGAIHDDSLCWQEGLEEWRPVKAIPELARIVREAAMSGRPSLTANSERPSQTPAPPQAGGLAGTGTLIPSSQGHGGPPNPPPQTSRAPMAPARPPTAAPMAPTPHPGGVGAPRPFQPNVSGSPGPAPFGAPGSAPSLPSGPAHVAAHAPAFGPGAGGAQRNNVVPISAGRLATAERLEDPAPAVLFAPTPPPAPVAPVASGIANVAADPFGNTAPAAPSPFSNMPGMSAGMSGPAPAMQTSPSGLAPSGAALVSLAPAPPQKRGTPLWAIAAIVFAGCFGIAVAVMVFMPKPPPVQPVAIQTTTGTVPAPPTAQPSADPSALAAATQPSATPDPSASTSAKVASSAPKNGGAIAAAGGPPAAGAHSASDIKNLLGGGPTGPNDAPGPGGGTTGSSGGGLDQAAVQNFVRQKQPMVRRKCWDVGGTDQRTSANVTVVASVAPDGSVSSATATGDEPVATCIGHEVKSWKFPAPGSTTTLNLPFHFVRQ